MIHVLVLSENAFYTPAPEGWYTVLPLSFRPSQDIFLSHFSQQLLMAEV
jgi:hypothetical protein